MPNNVIKSMAKKAGKSPKDAEKKWVQAKNIAKEELGVSEKDFEKDTSKGYKYAMNVFKKLLGIKENTEMKKSKKKNFFEMGMSAMEYIDSVYPGYDDEVGFDSYKVDMTNIKPKNIYGEVEDIEEPEMDFNEDDMEYQDTYYDAEGNPVNIEFEVEKEEPEFEETMVSGSFTAPKGPITGPINRRRRESKLKEANITNRKFLVEAIEGELTEDSYGKGEIGRPISSLYENVGKTFDSFEEMVEYLNRHYIIPERKENWFAFEPGRYTVQFLSDEDWLESSKREIEAWKKGELKLYSAMFNIYFKIINTYVPSTREMAEIGGVQY